MQLASRFGHVNQIRRERPLTREELMYHVPSIFGEDRHTSRSERYAYIPTITVLENLQREGFQPFFACQTRVRYESTFGALEKASEDLHLGWGRIMHLDSVNDTGSICLVP